MTCHHGSTIETQQRRNNDCNDCRYDNMADVGYLLQGYTQQHLPSLALRTGIPSARIHLATSRKARPAAEPCVLWTAVVRLVCAYADTSDVLLADLRDENGPSAPHVARLGIELNGSRQEAVQTVTRALQEATCWPFDELVCAARREGMKLREGQSPVLITLGSETAVKSDWYPVQGIAILLNNQSGTLSVVGDAAVLSEEMADIFLRQVAELDLQIAQSPTTSLKRITFDDEHLMSRCEPLYDPEEAHLPIEWLRRTACERPNAIAHELCDEPDEDAEVRTMTFGQLEEQSNTVANWLLHEHHVRRGAPIGVCRKRDEHFYVAMAAILKAGACYLPIDKDLPGERKSYIAQDSDAALILTDADGVQFSLAGKPSFDMDHATVKRDIARHSQSPPEVQVDLDDLAYILYTSGTSGKPKGCQLMHRGLYWAIQTFVDVPRSITDPDNDKRLAMAAVAFDVHVSEMVQGWAIGTRLVTVASRMSLLADLQGAIERFQITHIGMVPSMIEATLKKSPKELPIKYITSGGEKVSDAVLSKWASDPNILFVNMYGPTEATIGCTARIIRGTNEPKEDIGYPFKGSGAYITDADINIVPKGVAGELVIEGPLVARGYLNLPEATAKNFVEWPRKGCRAYRTGDLVRMNFDGGLSIHGRIDSQIKLRGVRIESEGVSAVISEAATRPKLDAVSVICKHEAVGNAEMLITFVTLQHDDRGQSSARPSANDRREKPALLDLPSAASTMQTLRQAAVKGLASYMRPSHIVPLTFFPLSHNGKIDTKPLVSLFAETPIERLMEVQGLGSKSNGAPHDDVPTTETEKIVIELVAQLAGGRKETLSPRRGLMESGLSSINCAKLATMIRKRTGSHLSVAQVLACETLADCASAVDRAAEGGKNSKVHPGWDIEAFEKGHRAAVHDVLEPDAIQALLPPLPVQPGVLFHAMHNKAGYVQHFSYSLHPSRALSLHDLKAAWTEVQRQLDILRVCFVLDGEQVVQVLLHPDHCHLQFSHQHADERVLSDRKPFKQMLDNTHILTGIAASINEDFSTPMFAVTAFHSQDDPDKKPRYMTVSFSHAIYDAFAVRTVLSTLDAVMTVSPRKEQVDLSLKRIVQQVYSSPEEEHKRFWQQSLQSAVLERARSQRVPVQPVRREVARRTNELLDVSLEAVQRVSASLGVTLQSFFNLAFALSARSLFEWEDVALFGNVRSGRNLALDGIDQAACPLVTVVPCVVDISLSKRSTRELLRVSHQALIASTAHENVSLGQVQSWVKARNLVEALFSCRIEQSVDRTHAYAAFEHVGTSSMDPEFALAVEMLLDQTADSIDVRIAHAPSAFSTELINSFIRRMQINVRALMEDGETEAGAMDASRRQLMGQTNGQRGVQVSIDPELVETLRQAVATYLDQDLEIIQPKTSLVSLGMTSLRAVALCHSLAKVHGLDVDPMDVVQGDSVLAIASGIARKEVTEGKGKNSFASATWHLTEDERGELGNIKLAENDEVDIGPCTPLQAGMLAQTVASEGKLYVHAFALELQFGGQTNQQDVLERLQQIWLALHARFGILRTSFHFAPKAGKWFQVQHAEQACPLQIEYESAAASTEESRRRAISALALTTEDAFVRPPIRLTLSSDHSRLVLALHHAMYDGVSLANLFGYAAAVYDGQALPDTPSFLPLARQLVATEEQATTYWVDRLQGTQTNVFVKPRPEESKSNQAWREGVEMTEEESQAALRFCRRYGVSLQSVGQVAFAASLYRHSRQPDVVFCQVVSGRARKEVGEVVGPVFNTVGVRVSLSGGVKAKQAVQRAQQDNSRSLPWQHAPLRLVQRRLHRTSLSDALFLFQPNLGKRSDSAARPQPWRLATSTSEEGSTQFALNLELHEAGGANGTMAVRASGAADTLTQAELKDFLALYKTELLDIVRAPNKVLAPEVQHLANPGGIEVSDNAQRPAPPSQAGEEAKGEMVDLLCQILQIKSALLNLQTNLSSIGLDSIAAMQVASRARKQGYPLSPMRVMRCATVADLLSAANESKDSQRGKTEAVVKHFPAIRPPAKVVEGAKKFVDASLRNVAKAYVPSAGMRYLFAGWQRSHGRQFQICIVRKLSERADVDALKRSWSTVVSRHAILRSTIVPSHDDGIPLVLFVVQQGHWHGLFRVEDRRSDRGKDKDETLQANEFGRQLLREPPSMRKPNSQITILRLETADYVFIHLPHTQYDAFTVPRLLAELWQSYAGHAALHTDEKGDDVELETYLAACLGDVEEERKALKERRKAYWQSTFGHSHQPHIWTEGEATGRQTDTVTYFVREARTGTPTVRALQEAADRLGLTPAALLTSTWAHVHARRTWLPDTSTSDGSSTFAFVHSGRTGEAAGLEDVFAPTINLVPTKVDRLLMHSTASCAADILSSIIGAARRIQDHWRHQPAWAVQSAMADVQSWTGSSSSLCNTTLNVQIRPSRSGSGSLRDIVDVEANGESANAPGWTPVDLRSAPHGEYGDRGWSQDELDRFNVPDLFINGDGGVTDPSIRIDARLVVAASRIDATAVGSESVVILEAEVAREYFARKGIDEALAQWAGLLTLVVERSQ